MTIKDFDMVEVIKEILGKPIKIGMRGAVIHIFTKPNLAYEVEFCDEYGQTVAQEPLLPNQVKKLESMTTEEYRSQGGSRYHLMLPHGNEKYYKNVFNNGDLAIRKWQSAREKFAENSRLLLACPSCDEANLVVDDVFYGSAGVTFRYLKCPLCGAYDIIEPLASI